MSLLEGIVRSNGGYTNDGTPRPINFSQDGGLINMPGGGSYQEACLRGEIFLACNQAAQAVSVALATAYTGICLSNPIGSNYRIAVLGANYVLSVAPAAIAPLFLIGNQSSTTNVTHTTPVTPRKALMGSADDSIAKVDSVATIPTPIYLMPIMGGFTAAALPGTTPTWVDLNGLLVLEPGGFVCIGALTAVTGFGGFVWREIPIL